MKARRSRLEISRSLKENQVERFGLVSRDFLGHVQYEFLVARFHFRTLVVYMKGTQPYARTLGHFHQNGRWNLHVEGGSG